MNDDKGRMIEELRTRLADVERLPGEEFFLDSQETLVRFLKARDWNLKESEKLLRATVAWRKKVSPLTVDCTACHSKPGMHSIRQVGFDEVGRPVIYTCFSQSSVHKYTVEDTVMHSVYLIENAKKTMKPGVITWVMIMDCTGMTLPACNPKLGYGSTQVLSNHYPERLGLVICINHNALFQGVWKAIKVFLHPNTTSKMKIVRSKKKIRDLFERTFSEELTNWLFEEIQLNKQRPMPRSQKEFWSANKSGEHDPRGCPSYVKNYIEPYLSKAGDPDTHKPHPNVVDDLRGEIRLSALSLADVDNGEPAGACANSNSSDSEDEEFEVLEDKIEEEFQIPKDAESIQM